MNISTMFNEAKQRKASDIHLASGEVPRIRIGGALVRLDHPPLNADSMSQLVESVLPSEAMARIAMGQTVERSTIHHDLTYAGIFFRTGDAGMAATFRILGKVGQDHERISEGAEAQIDQIVAAKRGLVIVSGPIMSGKWTTVSSIVERINARIPARIFVIEAHPSYSFDSKEGLVTKLHVGQDCESYVRALEIAHQSDLDVVAVDDIPTVEALREMLVLAETGHLVIANLHADNVVDVVERLHSSAGADARALLRSLALNLLAITSQRLFLRTDKEGRVPAYSYVMGTPAVKAALLSGDLSMLAEVQATEAEHRTLEEALDQLVQSGKITEDMASPYRLGS